MFATARASPSSSWRQSSDCATRPDPHRAAGARPDRDAEPPGGAQCGQPGASAQPSSRRWRQRTPIRTSARSSSPVPARAFSAGQDLNETAHLEMDQVRGWCTALRSLYQSVRDLSKPAVAAWNGIAAGAGMQIGLCCDVRVTHAGARIGQPEVRAGLASVVGTYFMSLYVGHGPNRELSLSGGLVSGRARLRDRARRSSRGGPRRSCRKRSKSRRNCSRSRRSRCG